jgi:energy-converting hydrogenase Eha subunit E
MAASESVAAIALYVGLIALCAGAIGAARGTIERKPARLAIPLIVVGAIGIALAFVAYAQSPRHMLPF